MPESVYSRMTKAEREVASELSRLHIRWSYEQPVFIWDDDRRPRVWTPDFYLVQFGIYVEVCGSETFSYNYRMKVYSDKGHQVIFLHLYKKSDYWKKHLLTYLKCFIDSRYNKLNKIRNPHILNSS
jgi:hypothetical protein